MSGYGAVPLSQEEAGQTTQISWRKSLGEKLESQRFHIAVLGLILLDSICVGIQIIYTFFHECQVPLLEASSHHWMLVAFEMAEVISMSICCLFLMECALSLLAFGPRFYLPGFEHWKLHLFDATGK
jgi:hypothetical protein